MNIKPKSKIKSFACISLIALMGVNPLCHAATNTASNEKGVDLVTSGGPSISISALNGVYWEFFKVPLNTPRDGNLSPRAERGLDPHTGGENLQGSNLTDGKKVIVLKGQCDVSSCATTTIMQIFNYDTKNADTAVPYSMIKAMRKDAKGRWEFEIIGNDTAEGVVDFRVNDSVFNFELRTNNKKARLIITQGGTTVYNKVWTLSTGNRAGITRFRFGAYHRGFDVDDAWVRFRDTQSTSVYPKTPDTGV